MLEQTESFVMVLGAIDFHPRVFGSSLNLTVINLAAAGLLEHP